MFYSDLIIMTEYQNNVLDLSKHNLYWIPYPFDDEKKTGAILLNSKSLGCIWVNEPEIMNKLITKYLNNEKLNSDEKSKIDLLYKNNLFTFKGSKTHKSYSCDVPQSSPIIFLNLVKTCNLRCRYCFEDKSLDSSPTKMSRDLAFSTIDRLLFHMKEKSQRSASVIFFGGEPLLNFGLLKEVINYTKQKIGDSDIDVTFGITTNFTLADDYILKYMKDNIDDILVSVDGFNEEQNSLRIDVTGNNSFNLVAANLEKADKMGLSYGIRSTVGSSNVNSLSELLDYYLKKPNIYEIDMVPISPFDSSGNIIDKKYYPNIEDYVTQLKLISKEHFLDLPRIAPFSIFINQIHNGGREYPNCEGFC